jgi:hypothetical protein
MNGAGRPLSVLFAVVLIVFHPAIREGRAAPAVTTRTELELTAIGTLGSGEASALYWLAAARFDLRLSYDRSAFILRLDPGVLIGPTTQSSWGLTEAFLEWRRPQCDFRFGVERSPLETARLTIPFLIEAVDVLGTRQGRLGARLNWYPDQATRVRLALLEYGGRMGPAVSLRRAFGAFEVDAHALTFGEGRAAVGAGASGLIGSLVVYGEIWSLTAPSETRYAAGLTGSIRDGLWTVEAGYAAALTGALARLQPGGAPARLQLAGQVMRRFGEDVAASATARVFSDPDAYRGQAVLEITRTAGDAAYTAALILLVGPEPAQAVATAGVRFSF